MYKVSEAGILQRLALTLLPLLEGLLQIRDTQVEGHALVYQLIPLSLAIDMHFSASETICGEVSSLS